ncbi:MAG: FAD-dependent oxidoreductase [Betaproteobacteria bacterium]|nr:FAD-dependent oxidoreductase [Betaproteobacteria bacterium]
MKRAIVVGGSMAGLFAANLLHRSGWHVDVFERSKAALSGRGAGIVTHDGLLYALQAAGAQVDDALGVGIHKRLAISKAGDPFAYCDFEQVLTSWSRLLGYLKEALPDPHYHLDEEVVEVQPGTSEALARVTFASGESLTADLVVAADGLKSSLRRQLQVPFRQVYAGYVAWRAVCDLSVLSDNTRRLMGDTFLFSQLPGEQILAYPIAGPQRADQILVNMVWYRRTPEDQLRDLLTDEQGVWHSEGIPPHKIRHSHIDKMRTNAVALFHASWAEHLEKSDSIILQPIFDSEVETMATGRVAFIGDAAFVARPHVGQGVTKAAGDALCLAKTLRDAAMGDIPKALTAFSEARMQVGRMAVNHARQMGAPVVISPLLEDGSHWQAYYSDPENLIRDTAVELEGVVRKDEGILH